MFAYRFLKGMAEFYTVVIGELIYSYRHRNK